MQSVASTFAGQAVVAAKPQRAAQAARASVVVRAQKQEAVSNNGRHREAGESPGRPGQPDITSLSGGCVPRHQGPSRPLSNLSAPY